MVSCHYIICSFDFSFSCFLFACLLQFFILHSLLSFFPSFFFCSKYQARVWDIKLTNAWTSRYSQSGWGNIHFKPSQVYKISATIAQRRKWTFFFYLQGKSSQKKWPLAGPSKMDKGATPLWIRMDNGVLYKESCTRETNVSCCWMQDVNTYWKFSHRHCCSVAELCLTLCDPKNCSMPGFPGLHHLPECAWTHVHWAGDAI